MCRHVLRLVCKHGAVVLCVMSRCRCLIGTMLLLTLNEIHAPEACLRSTVFVPCAFL